MPPAESSRLRRHAACTTQAITSYSAEAGVEPVSDAVDDVGVVADSGPVIVGEAVARFNVVICLVATLRVLTEDNVDI